jgi:diaminopimelate decarboxylase
VRISLEPSRAQELAGRFNTPLYVYDLDVVTERVAALRAALPARFDLAYAVKANPSLAVLAHLGGLGVGGDVASGGELEAVLRAGIAPERVIFTGPAKRDDELAREAGRRIPGLLRASTGGGPAGSIIATAGFDKFGMVPADLARAARFAADHTELELLGVHAFGASNVRDAAELVEHVRATVELGARLLGEVGVPLRFVDVGGGLGIPYADDEAPLDLEALAGGLVALETEWADDPALADLRLLFEPGRFLLGPAGAYLTRVLDVKAAPQGEVALVDGGVHHLLRPALVGQEQRMLLLAPDAAQRATAPIGVAGPLCTGVDRFSIAAPLPAPRRGDLIAVLDCGAYGYSESMPFFLSHPTPAEVVLRGGEAFLARPRLDPSELLDRQLVPPALAPAW